MIGLGQTPSFWEVFFCTAFGKGGKWKEQKGKEGKGRNFLCLDDRGEKNDLFGNVVLIMCENICNVI